MRANWDFKFERASGSAILNYLPAANYSFIIRIFYTKFRAFHFPLHSVYGYKLYLKVVKLYRGRREFSPSWRAHIFQ